MHIALFNIINFRNVLTASLAPLSSGCNIFYGANGSGKTSLLEAIYIVGLGRSFRSSMFRDLISQKMDKFTIFAQILNKNIQQNITIGIERTTEGDLKWRLNEKEISSSAEIAALLPMRVMNSHSHDLIELGPHFRRKFLDWGLFYQFDYFLTCFKKFEMALKQRNVLLRDKKYNKTHFNTLCEQELDSWTEILIKQATELTQLRQQYVQSLMPYLMIAIESLLSLSGVQMRYMAGWDENEQYATILTSNMHEDCRMGYTQYGPHRADLEIWIDSVPAKYFLSRGQQKLLVCAMMLAQGMLLRTECDRRVIYLVDDLSAELDHLSRQKLISLLLAQQTQVFVTAIEKEMIYPHLQPAVAELAKMFHVKHGKVFAD